MTSPEEYVLYRHWDKNGKLLYAGRTNNPPARLGKHRGAAAWWADVSWTSYEKFPSLEALKAGEAWAIRNENPQWNIQGREYGGESRQSSKPDTFGKYRPITTRDLAPEIKLVHPLSREFWVYGGDDTMRRAREWALTHRYYLLDSGPRCAHVFYRMDCPNTGGSYCLPGQDHTRVWVPAPYFSDFENRSGADNPFILTQPYNDALDHDDGQADDEIPSPMADYAKAHGLNVSKYIFDSWYNPPYCTAIRFTPAGYAVWPLETEALSLMCAWRDDWPDAVPEWLK